jgi:Domain of unknown function (DUF222)
MTGAAAWVDVRVPIVSPEGWSIDELREGIREVERIHRETEAAMALLVSALPETRDSVADLARTSKCSNREARRRLDIAKVAKNLPRALALLGSGSISGEHLRVLAPVSDMQGADQLLDGAETKTPEQFSRDAEQFRIDVLGGKEIGKRQRARRMLRFFNGPEGMIGLTGLLPPLEGTELKTKLAALVDARWRDEHPERAATLGAHGGDSHEQRTADALLALTGVGGLASSLVGSFAGSRSGSTPGSSAGPSARAAAAPQKLIAVPASVRPPGPPGPPGPGPGPLRTLPNSNPSTEDPGREANAVSVQTAKPAVIILFNVDKWEAEIVGGGPIPVTPSLFDQTRADLYYCFQNMVGEILKFGKSRRYPTAVQRLAVIARDRRCIYPDCTSPPNTCDVHHCDEVEEDDGATDVEVMGLLCHAHHRHLHVNKQVIEREPDGSITVRDRVSGVSLLHHTRKEAA